MTKKFRLVLAERERSARARYKCLLTKEGFVVDTAADRATVKTLCGRSLPDLAILSIHLGEDREAGFQLCRELRARSLTLPIILFGEDDNDVDRIASYRLGADDYTTRDRDPRVLSCRIHALLQRVAECARPTDGDTGPSHFCRGRLRLDRETCRAYWGGRRVELTITQFHMLQALVESSGEVRSLAELMRAAGVQVQPNTVTATIARIRRQFRSIDHGFDAIRNAHGRGYLWLA